MSDLQHQRRAVRRLTRMIDHTVMISACKTADAEASSPKADLAR